MCVIPWIFAVLKSVTGCFFCVYVCVPSIIKQTKGKHAYKCSLFIWFHENNILKDCYSYFCDIPRIIHS